jgi:hypothetical protein
MFMFQVGFELTTAVFNRDTLLRTSDRVATAIAYITELSTWV